MEVSNTVDGPTATIEFREEAAILTPASYSALGKMLAGDLPFKPKKTPTIRGTVPLTGRNAPCPCGSGKKYKKCHLSIVTEGVN